MNHPRSAFERAPARAAVRSHGACLLWMMSVGCGANHGVAFPRAMHEADSAAERGNYQEAARLMDRVAQVARTGPDRDEARHAAARLLLRAGDDAAGLERLDSLGRESPAGPEAASASYDAARLRLARGDTEDGFRGVEAVIHRFPNDGNARSALRRWLRHLDETAGPRATLLWLRGVQRELDATDCGEEVAYETALRLEALGDVARARAAFVEVATRWPYPGGALWDDALYHASVLDEANGHPEAAVADLERLLARRERAIFVGSAERSRYATAQLHVGELYRDALSNLDAARAAFHALATDYPDSTLRERGRFEEAAVLLRLGRTGEACTTLATLVAQAPDSPYASCARPLCPALRVAARVTLGVDGPPLTPTGAESTCHPYILKRLGGAGNARAESAPVPD